MALQPNFGPNHAAVEAFIGSLDAIPWYSRVGQPTQQDEQLVRVNLDFLARQHGDPYASWGEALVVAESRIEQLVFDHRRLDEYAEVQNALGRRGLNQYRDDFFTGLFDKYPGYYGDTDSYAHELMDEPLRLITGAGYEIMLADIDPSLSFFQDLMPWFRAGHWPAGWEGRWPSGKLILW